MAYQIAATAVTLNDLESHSPVAGLFKCNPSNICAAFYTISTDSVLTRFFALAELLVIVVLHIRHLFSVTRIKSSSVRYRIYLTPQLILAYRDS